MIDIGNELKELRRSKGLSLKEISESTRINIKYLDFLEQNNFTFLPEVYVRSFLKTYVKFLGEDERKFLELLEEHLHPKSKIEVIPEKIDDEESVEIKSQKFELNKFLIGKTNILTLKNVLFFISAFIFIVLILTLIFTQKSETKIEETSVRQEVMFEESEENKSQNFSNLALNDSLVLGISAKDTVWIQVKIDDSKIEEVYLRNGDSKKFKAKNDFQLLVGNAGGIILYLNETELPFTGVKGSVKRLKVDKKGVKLIQVKNEPQRQ